MLQKMKTHFPRQTEPLADITSLRHYPQGSFGKVWADTLDDHSLKPFTVGPRRVQLHDGLHALLGYGVDLIDEARVQAFLLGTENRAKPINAILLGALVLKVLKQLRKAKGNHPQSRHTLLKALQQAYERGRNSTLNPDTWQPETLWHLPIEQVRAYYHV
jgi:ubiquinone biosynthesis protein COQ4